MNTFTKVYKLTKDLNFLHCIKMLSDIVQDFLF